MWSVHLTLGQNAVEEDYLYAQALCEHYGFSVVSSDRERGSRTEADYMSQCDVVLANMRKSLIGEPDFHVIYELGIGFAKEKRLYGFMPDSRDYIHRWPFGHFGEDGTIQDQYELAYSTALTIGNLMYSVPTKIVEGDLALCVKTLWYDQIEALKERGQRITPLKDLRYSCRRKPGDPHLAYLAGYECFNSSRTTIGESMVHLCRKNGFDADYPTSPVNGLRKLDFADLMNPLVGIAASFDHDQYKVQCSDITIANVNPYHGLLPDSGTVFELGMAVGLGQLCVVYYHGSKDVLQERMLRPHGWLTDRRKYDPAQYEQILRALFRRDTAYVRGEFSDAVHYVKRKLNKEKTE